MYANVVVLTYQSPDINYFTYLIPKTLQSRVRVGQLVQVPFGKRQPFGIVLSIDNSQSTIVKNIKLLSSIVFPQPILLPYQIDLLKWMSFYYLAPMVNCLEAMLPTAALNAKRLLTNANTKYKIQNTKYQSIVLVPTINHLPQVLAQFPKAKNYAIYHNELNPSEKFSTWLKIQSGKVDYIFGSRSALFAPCPNLKEIIIFDEHDGAYKDERSPYFDTLTVAEKIAILTGAKIRIVDASPKISTYFQFTEPRSFDPQSGTQDDSKRGSKNIVLTKTKVKPIIVSMKEERLTQNFSPISDFLLTRLKASQDSLLFLNKKKESGSLYCKSCNTHIYLEKQPENCPNCNSSDFYFNLLNITSLAREVRRQIPNAKINLISDSSHYPTIQFTRQSLGGGGLSNYPTIDIATVSIFYTPQLKKYDLVAHISPDTLLNRADFSSSEALYEQIANLKTLLKKDGVLILQTQNPENLTIKSAASGNYAAYYNEQLKLRRTLFYPPFALLVKLTIRGKVKEKVESNAQNLLSRIRRIIPPSDHPTIQVFGPFQPFFFSKIPTYNIIIKCKLESYSLAQREKAIGKLQHLRNLKDVQITVDPKSIS